MKLTGKEKLRTALTIAGSDSGGGAGIQADLKAFTRAGVFGCCAVTAITAQNTCGVDAIEHVSPGMIKQQIATVTADIDIDAVKIGMLGRVETVLAVRDSLALLPPETPIVIDPVMVAESGAVLLQDDAITALIQQLIPLATVVTPNVAEAKVLCGEELEPQQLARKVHSLGASYTLVTGGHLQEPVDHLFDGNEMIKLSGKLYPGGNSHGSGCTHSSTLAAYLAKGQDVPTAAAKAKLVAATAVANGLAQIGSGAGPVDVLGLVAGD